MNPEHISEIASNLICSACGNVPLLESNIPIAEELKDIIETLYEKGWADKEIINYMLQNYSEFIYLDAPQNLNVFAVALWIFPVFVSFFFAYIILRIYNNKTSKNNN